MELICEQWSSGKTLGLEELVNLYFWTEGDVKFVPGGTMFWEGMQKRKILFFVVVCWQVRLLAFTSVQLHSCCSWGRIKCSSSYPYIFDEMSVEVCQEYLSIALFREGLIGMDKVIKVVCADELNIVKILKQKNQKHLES